MLLFVVLINDPSFLHILLSERGFSSLRWYQASNCSLVAEFHLKCWDVFISPLQAYSFRCWFSNNPVVTFLEGCFPSSYVAEVGIFSYILLFQWSIVYSVFRRHCDVALFTHHPNYEDRVFSCLSCNRSVVSSFQVLFILSSLASLFNRSDVRIWSSLFFIYLVSTRVVSIPSCPLYSSFIALHPPRFTWCSLFLFSTIVLSVVFNSIVLFISSFQPLKVLWFHSLVEEAT